MSIYDIVMLVIFFGSVIFGYRKGLAWQIASLAAIVISYFVAINFRNPVAQLISVEAPWNQFAAMLLLFLGTSLVVWTVYASTSKSIKRLELRGFDRQAGAILGVFKGGILCMLVTLFAVSLFGSTRNMVHNSATGHYVVSGIQQFSRFTPTELAGFLNPHLEQFGNNIGGIPAKRDFFPTANSQGQFQTNQTASGQGTLGGFNNQFQASTVSTATLPATAAAAIPTAATTAGSTKRRWKLLAISSRAGWIYASQSKRPVSASTNHYYRLKRLAANQHDDRHQRATSTWRFDDRRHAAASL